MTSFFLPSRFLNYDFQTILKYAKSNQIGYQVYFLVIFPISLALLFFRNSKVVVYFSTAFLFINNDLFESSIDLIFNDYPLWTTGLFRFIIPLIIVILVGLWLINKSLNKKSYLWYAAFLLLIIGFYLIINDRNCMIEFVSDMGFKKYDLSIWFSNCGTYYAWWLSGILLNIGIVIDLIANKKSS